MHIIVSDSLIFLAISNTHSYVDNQQLHTDKLCLFVY